MVLPKLLQRVWETAIRFAHNMRHDRGHPASHAADEREATTKRSLCDTPAPLTHAELESAPSIDTGILASMRGWPSSVRQSRAVLWRANQVRGWKII